MMRELLIGSALVLGLIYAADCNGEKRGRAAEQLEQGQQQTKEGEKTLARVDTIYKLDTIRLTREVKKWQALRDTLVITDTVIVRAALKQADSTIKACLMTVQTCEQKDSAHKVIEAGLRRQNDALKKLVPGKTERLLTALKWGAVGFIVGKAVR